MSFKDKYDYYLKVVENNLQKLLDYDDLPQANIFKAINYSVSAGGKRLRPVLLLAVSEMLNGDINEIMPLASALEMIHTYSLIHDDLPSMDNDDLRRGKPTLHKVYNEALAILAGDGLLNYAFEVVLDNQYINNENWKKYIKASKYLANAAGINGMIAGQVVDIESEGKDIDIKTLKYMHEKKTGALLKAAVLLPAIMYCNDERMNNDLENYADKIGLAFQIKDDILDVEGDSETLGKPQGSDQENNKSTYISFYGLEKSKENLRENIESALSSIQPYGEKAEFLKDIALYIYQREK